MSNSHTQFLMSMCIPVVVLLVLTILIGAAAYTRSSLGKPTTSMLPVTEYNKVVHFDATTLDEAVGMVEKLSTDYNIVSQQVMPTYNETRWGVATVSYEITGYRVLIVYSGGR